MIRLHRRTVLLILAPLFAALTILGSTGQAHAAGYRYWSFWDRDGGAWVYATQGPSTARPSDGDVQGFRFSVSEDSRDAAKPRGAAEFATICAKTPARDGSKRVALVLDFGTDADAPSGETPPRARTACARVPEDATTADALAAVAKPLRYDTNALLCAIAGYPRAECGEQVSATQPTATPSDTARDTSDTSTSGESESGGDSADQGPSLGLLAGIGAVAVLGAAAVWQTRRRQRG
ncbi:SCO2322 family protein [Streptomyces sp. NPDC006365]|uniref:SCO2322 family protein n=1 Tax=Streptomyces sp. NPDC006365 TaxID=3364744 RepID=UPI003692CC47